MLEAKVFDGGDAFVARNGIFAHEAGVEDVEAERSRLTLLADVEVIAEMSSMKAPRLGRDLM
jgi:hypothetical protein